MMPISECTFYPNNFRVCVRGRLNTHFLSSVERQHACCQPCRLEYTTPSAVVKNVAGRDITRSDSRHLDFPCLSSTRIFLLLLSTSFPFLAADFLSRDDQCFEDCKLKILRSLFGHVTFPVFPSLFSLIETLARKLRMTIREPDKLFLKIHVFPQFKLRKLFSQYQLYFLCIIQFQIRTKFLVFCF